MRESVCATHLFWLSEIRKIGRRLESDRFAGSRMYEGELGGVQTQACGIGFAFKSRMTVKGVAVNGATEPFGAMHTQLVRAARDRAQAHESFRSSRSLLSANHDKFCGRRLLQ